MLLSLLYHGSTNFPFLLIGSIVDVTLYCRPLRACSAGGLVFSGERAKCMTLSVERETKNLLSHSLLRALCLLKKKPACTEA